VSTASSVRRPAARLLALQRAAGNRAVARLVDGSRVPMRRLQRFVGWEHERIGNKGSMAKCRGRDPAACRNPIVIEVAPGVSLTWGQIVAVAGDEIGTVEELQYYAAAAGPKGTGDDETRGYLRAALKHGLDDRPDGPNVLPPGLYDGGDAARKAQESDFADLAFQNLSHFPSGARAREEWKSHHDRAIVEALRAGEGKPGHSMNQAYLLEAFGDHFLTDMFSASHIRTPRSEIVAWYEVHWASRARTNFKMFLLRKALQYISPDAMARLLSRWGKTLDSLIAIVIAELTPAVAGAISGTIHDYEGEHGVEVTAPALGMQFTTWGDDSLPGARGRAADRTSGIAEALAVEAIGTARTHLEIAFEVGQDVAAGARNERAGDLLSKRGVVYPYEDVLKYVPTAVPGANPTPWRNWRWGDMDPWMHDQVNAYARDKIGSRRADVVSQIPDWTIQINDGAPFSLRKVVDDALAGFAADPLGTIGELILWPALDPRYVPATAAKP
jgi:hypothetical protein